MIRLHGVTGIARNASGGRFAKRPCRNTVAEVHANIVPLEIRHEQALPTPVPGVWPDVERFVTICRTGR